MPYAECVLRIVPLKSLGGRSPYEVVTGLRPKLPVSLLTKFPVQEISVDTYAERLLGYLRSMWDRIKALAEDLAGKKEESASGSLNRELRVGDLVMRRLSPNAKKVYAEGKPLRWARNVDPIIYRVVALVNNQPGAVRLVDHGDPTRELTSFAQPVSKDHLIRLDMPELEPGISGPRKIEFCRKDGDTWDRGTLEGTTMYGRAKIRGDENPTEVEMVDIAATRYRWVLGEVSRDAEGFP